MGNGAKAAMKRDRNATEKKGGGSQLDANAKAMDKQCKKCMQTFLTTTSKKGLDEHAGKHNMTGKDAFGEAVYNASKDAKAPK